MPTREQPLQTYYPGAKARLTVRFEDFGTRLVEPKSLKPPQLRKGIGTKELDIERVGGRLVLRAKGSDGNFHGSPQEQTKSDDKLTFEIAGIIPQYATHQLNGIRTADTLSIELRYIDLPIDPRVVRSCAIEFYLGTVSEADFESGVTGGLRNPTDGSKGEPLSMIPDTYTDSNGVARTNLRFQGWVDDWEVEWPTDSAGMVRLECTDNTRMLIDQPIPPKLVIGTDEPIDMAVATYLANFPQFRGLGVRYLPAGVDVPILKDALAATSHKPKLGPAAGKGGTSKLSIWDYITDVCGSIGHTVRFEGVDVVIQRARTLYSGEFAGRPDDPFTGRILPSSRELKNRLYIYGRNIEEMRFKRRFTVSAPTNIEVRCFPTGTLVNASDVNSAYRRWYEGPMVRITTVDGRCFTGTPNHQMLTLRGWVPLGMLDEGDDLVDARFGERMEAFRDPNMDHVPTEIDKAFDAFHLVGTSNRRAGRNVDFHGDGFDSEIEIVTVDRELLNRFKSTGAKHHEEIDFVLSDQRLRSLQGDRASGGASTNLITSSFDTERCFVSGAREALTLTGGASHEAILRRFFERSDNNSASGQCVSQRTGIDAEFLGELVQALSPFVSTRKVIDVTRIPFFCGHVFNLETASAWYAVEGLITHNCYNGRRKKTLVARYPLKKDRVMRAPPGNETNDKWLVVRVSGIEDEKTLRVIAQGVYETIGRREMEVSLTTKNLGSFGGGNLDPDALDLKVGDPVDIEVNRDTDAATINAIEEKTTTQAAEYLKALGYSPAFATAYAQAATNLGVPTTFRVRGVSYDWDNEEGIVIDLELVNYIEVRADKQLPEGEELKPSDIAGASPVTVKVDDE